MKLNLAFFLIVYIKILFIIHNNGKLYQYDFEKEEISMLKPRIFEPESISNSTMFMIMVYQHQNLRN